jgi:hypothetical protein
MADKATVKDVKEFFGMDLPEMKREWIPLPAADKEQIMKGIGDGTLDY